MWLLLLVLVRLLRSVVWYDVYRQQINPTPAVRAHDQGEEQ